MDEDHLTNEEAALLDEIRTRRRKLVATHRRNKSAANNAPVMPRTADAQRGRTIETMKVWLTCCVWIIHVDAHACVCHCIVVTPGLFKAVVWCLSC